MDFKRLFDSYTNNIDTSERSNIFTQSAPPENLSSLQSFIENYDSNEESNNLPEPNLTKPEEETTTSSIEIPEGILDALSNLDNPKNISLETLKNKDLEDLIVETDQLTENLESDEFNNELLADDLTDDSNELSSITESELLEGEFTPEFNTDEPVADDLTDEPLSEPNELNSELLEDDLTDESDELGSITESELLEDEFTPEFDTDEPVADDLTDEPLSEPNEPNSELPDDELDLSSFLEDIGGYETDDTQEVFFSEEEINDPNSTDSFTIELPEEFSEEPIQELEVAEQEEQTDDLTLPDFNDTEISIDSSPIPDINQEFAPTEYESVDKSVNFDVWDTHKKPSVDSILELSEEQVFKIRYKINSLPNKAMRFKIREIIADPDSNQEFYDTLMSLLLIDAPEGSFNKFFEQIEDSQGNDSYPITDVPQYVSSFLAQDVLEYQDTIYQLKNEFVYNLKKYFLYGFIALLTGVIAWLGVAQPLRVNSIFEKGLTAIRNDNFTEGEALFNQANQIAGSPVAEWYMKYADVYKDKNLITEAENKYLSALVIEPKNTTIAIHTSDFYTNLGPKYFTNAIIIMQNIAGYYPKRFEVWDYLGSLFINYSDYFIDDRDQQTASLYDAIDTYQKFIINNPKNPAPFYRMLDIYIRIGNKEQIDKIARLLIQLNPKYINIDMMNRLAKYYTDNRNLTGSDQVFRKIVPLLDSYSQNIEPLQKSMEKLYNVDPANISNILSESYYEFARYKMLSSDFKSAGLLLTNSLIFNPNQENGYNLLGEAYMRSTENTQTKLSRAKELFEHVLSTNPNNYKAHINLGHLYYMWDQEFGATSQDKALYHYKYASTVMPPNIKNALLSYNYGWLEYQNNNAPVAIELWSDIYKVSPENPVLSYALGSALFQSGNPQLSQVILNKTADHLEQLRKNIPLPDIENKRHREIYTQLAKVYNNLGVINANYGVANPGRREYFESQALLNFYKAQDLADQINNIYSTAEYNIGVLTRPNIRNRRAVFDDDIPKQTSLENPTSYFNQLLLQSI
ncbi:MAG: hypothetical protein ACRC0X_08390 [Brevinema sp.]